MRAFKIILASFCAITLSYRPQDAKGWRGIVPLHSTRADVERLLGAPVQPGQTSVYRVGDDSVQVDYAVSPCKGSLLGWNVSPDTVLQLRFFPLKKDQFNRPDLENGKYIRAYGHVNGTYYINLDEGIRYEVLPEGVINSVTYIPSSKDARLRCSGFPRFDGGASQYRPYDTYGDIPRADEEARLDNFAFALQSGPELKGYIITYAGQTARISEAKTYAERAREYLINKRGIASQRIVALDGGYREKMETELYLVPSDLPAPTPTPTIPSTKVQIIRTANAKTTYHRSSQIRRKRH
jgi:hypothetical protein